MREKPRGCLLLYVRAAGQRSVNDNKSVVGTGWIGRGEIYSQSIFAVAGATTLDNQTRHNSWYGE